MCLFELASADVVTSRIVPPSARSALALALAVIACIPSSSSPPPDAGADAPLDAGQAAPAPPALADWSCPAGWTQVPGFVDESGAPAAVAGVAQFSRCQPAPRLDCPRGEAQWLGAAACKPIGTECPAGEFLDEASVRASAPGFSGSLRYARSGGSAGTGTAASPFSSLHAALAAAAPGDIVVLARGVFSEAVTLGAPIAVVGACVSGTTVSSSVASDAAGVIGIQAAGAGSFVSNLSLTGSRPGVWIEGSGRKTTLSSVEVFAAGGLGIFLQVSRSTPVRLNRVVVRDMNPGQAAYATGNGLVVGGGQVELSNLVIERTRGGAVFLDSSSLTATVNDLVVRDTREQLSDQLFGQGMGITGGAHVVLTRALVAGNRAKGISVSDATSVLEGADVVVRATAAQALDGTLGRGLEVVNGARVTLARLLLEQNTEAGCVAQGSDTSVELTDALIRDTAAQPADGRFGEGLDVSGGARAVFRRLVLERNRAFGAAVFEAGSTLELSDLVVRGTRSEPGSGQGGIGAAAQSGASLVVDRAVLDGNRTIGIGAEGAGTVATLRDVAVRDTASMESTGNLGRGVNVQLGAHATIERLEVVRARNVGLLVLDAASSVTASDLTIRDTLVAECGLIPEGQSGSCIIGGSNEGIGDGLGVVQGALSLTRFALGHEARVGMLVAEGGHLYASDGLVTGNPVGLAVVASPSFDFSLVDTSVQFLGNQVRLSADALPIPAGAQSAR